MNIKENKQVYDYGCVMLYFDNDKIKPIFDLIDKSDLYTEDDGFGLEEESHCTLLYGLHPEVTIDDIKNITEKYEYSDCLAHNISLFNSEKYDVLKFDISGSNLHETNSDLKKYPHTTEYPDYHPHMTIAYLKKGLGEKYIKSFHKKYDNIKLKPSCIVYSMSNGKKVKVIL